MIYLFTTTKRSLYKRDLLNVCCYPDGWQIKFGYKKEYIPSQVLSNCQAILKGSTAVIVFCEPVDEDDLFYKYQPIRRGKIVNVERDFASSLTLTISLRRVFDYSQKTRDAQVEDFQKFIEGLEDRPQTKKSERKADRPNRFISLASIPFASDAWTEWAASWHSLAEHLGELVGLRDSFFLRFDPDYTVKNREKCFPAPRLNGVSCPIWRLCSGTMYNLQFEIIAGSEANTRHPTITGRDDFVSVLGPFTRQRGNGTEIEFKIAIKRLFQNDYSVFIARVEPRGNRELCSSEFSGILEVIAQKWLLRFTLLLLVLGMVALTFDSYLLEQWFGAPDASQSWLNGKVALYVAKTVGFILLTAGGFLGFRKLPLID